MRTTYSPERPEIVYCEECYLKEVYDTLSMDIEVDHWGLILMFLIKQMYVF